MPPNDISVETDPIEVMADTFIDYQRKTHRLFLAVDRQAAMTPTFLLTTEVLHALDDCREAAAILGFYLAQPLLNAQQEIKQHMAEEMAS